MDARFFQEGKALDYVPSSPVSAGEVVALQNNYFGIAKLDIAANELGALAVTGVFAAAKAAGAIAFGALLYWDSGNKRVQTTPITNAYIGRAAAPAEDAEKSALFALNASNIGDVSTPEAKSSPAATATTVTATVTDPDAATNLADVTLGDTYATDSDALEAAINANRADIANLITFAGAAKADIKALEAAVNALIVDVAAVVSTLEAAGIFEQ